MIDKDKLIQYIGRCSAISEFIKATGHFKVVGFAKANKTINYIFNYYSTVIVFRLNFYPD